MRKILVAVDGSDTSNKAVSLAVELAQAWQAELMLVYVFDAWNEVMMGTVVRSGNEIEDAVRRVSDQVLSKVMSHVDPDKVQVTTHLKRGNPASELLACADETKPDLIVMGSRGMSPFKGLMVGSVSLGVLHRAPCPRHRGPLSGATAMEVRELMSPSVHTIDASATLAEAVRMMQAKRIRHLPVLREGALVGVLSERDMLSYQVEHEDAEAAPVEAIMSSPPQTIHPNNSVGVARERMARRKIGCLPVTSGRAIVGMLTRHDLLCSPAPDVPKRLDTLSVQLAQQLQEWNVGAVAVVNEKQQLLGVVSYADIQKALSNGPG